MFFAYKTLKISHALANFNGLGEPFYTWLKYGGSACLAFALLILVFSFQRGLLSRLLSLKLPGLSRRDKLFGVFDASHVVALLL